MTNKSRDPIDVDGAYAKNNSLRAFLHIIYGTYIVSIFFSGMPILLAVIFAYFKRGDSLDTPYESHYDYVISTFWRLIVVLIIAVIAGLFIFFISAILIFPLLISWTLIPILGLLVVIWFLYRTIRGWLCLFDNREIPDSYF